MAALLRDTPLSGRSPVSESESDPEPLDELPPDEELEPVPELLLGSESWRAPRARPLLRSVPSARPAGGVAPRGTQRSGVGDLPRFAAGASDARPRRAAGSPSGSGERWRLRSRASSSAISRARLRSACEARRIPASGLVRRHAAQIFRAPLACERRSCELDVTTMAELIKAGLQAVSQALCRPTSLGL